MKDIHVFYAYYFMFLCVDIYLLLVRSYSCWRKISNDDYYVCVGEEHNYENNNNSNSSDIRKYLVWQLIYNTNYYQNITQE